MIERANLMVVRFFRWCVPLLALGITVVTMSCCCSVLRGQPAEPVMQPVNVEPLASAVFPTDINLDILGSGQLVAFKKDYLLSYSEAAAIYSSYAFDKFPRAEGLATIVVTRSDTRQEADGLFEQQCNSWDYPKATSQFNDGRACVSVVKATEFDDAGIPEWYQAYLVVQNGTLVIDIRQHESHIPDTTLRGDVVKFLADHLPDLAQQLDRIAANRSLGATDLPMAPSRVWKSPVDGAEYVFVPRGSFSMSGGTVDLGDFWITRTEVTNAQYHRCVQAGACEAPTRPYLRWDLPGVANLPVTGVTWQQAVAYAQWVGGRLPTEAEWEKACRGTDGRTYPWGDSYPSDYSWQAYSQRIALTMVEAYRPVLESGSLVLALEWPLAVGSNRLDVSPFGVLDMADNAAEWTTTLWGRADSLHSAFSFPYRADDGRENLDSSSQLARVIRGAARRPPLARCDDRDYHQADYGTFLFREPVGFRVVCPSAQTCTESPWVAPPPTRPAPTPTAVPPVESKVNQKDGALYLLVPAGEFIVGADHPSREANEQTQQTFFLDAFWISRTEITNEQYARCAEAGACTEPHNQTWQGPWYKDYPVTDVSWEMASAYATWAGGRLPSEAEWEKACRGTDGRTYPWGNQEPDESLSTAPQQGEYASVAPVYHEPVGPSPYGVFNLAGNVNELAGLDGVRARRGGIYVKGQYLVRCTARTQTDTSGGGSTGFRVVLTTK